MSLTKVNKVVGGVPSATGNEGTIGQVLTKISNASGDYGWQNLPNPELDRINNPSNTTYVKISTDGTNVTTTVNNQEIFSVTGTGVSISGTLNNLPMTSYINAPSAPNTYSNMVDGANIDNLYTWTPNNLRTFVDNEVDVVSQEGIQPGAIVPFYTLSSRTGFLKCDNGTHSRFRYPNLWDLVEIRGRVPTTTSGSGTTNYDAKQENHIQLLDFDGRKFLHHEGEVYVFLYSTSDSEIRVAVHDVRETWENYSPVVKRSVVIPVPSIVLPTGSSERYEPVCVTKIYGDYLYISYISGGDEGSMVRINKDTLIGPELYPAGPNKLYRIFSADDTGRVYATNDLDNASQVFVADPGDPTPTLLGSVSLSNMPAEPSFEAYPDRILELEFRESTNNLIVFRLSGVTTMSTTGTIVSTHPLQAGLSTYLINAITHSFTDGQFFVALNRRFTSHTTSSIPGIVAAGCRYMNYNNDTGAFTNTSYTRGIANTYTPGVYNAGIWKDTSGSSQRVYVYEYTRNQPNASWTYFSSVALNGTPDNPSSQRTYRAGFFYAMNVEMATVGNTKSFHLPHMPLILNVGSGLNEGSGYWMVSNRHGGKSTSQADRSMVRMTEAWTFRAPELRGEFIRSLDEGRGIDTSPTRGLGSVQSHDIQSHRHSLRSSSWENNNCAGLDRSAYVAGRIGSFGTPSYYSIANSGWPWRGAFISNTGGAETRPRNVALPYFIKT